LAELTERNSERLREYHDRVKTLTKGELADELENLKDELADEEGEMRLIIGQTGVHINAKQVDAYRESFAREMDFIKKKIGLVQEAMG
jgi:ribosomal protein L29